MARLKTVALDISQVPARKYKRGEHPVSLANLKPPFKKGENGNHSKGYSLTQALKDTLGNPKERRKLIMSTLEGAILREPTPFKEVWDRVEGKVLEQRAEVVITLTGDDLARIYREARGAFLQAGGKPLGVADGGGDGERPAAGDRADEVPAVAPSAQGASGNRKER